MFSVSPRFISIPQSFIFSTVFPNPLLRVIRLSEISRLTLLIVVCFAVLSIWMVRKIMRSAYGRAITALRNDEIAFSSLGRNPIRIKVLIVALSAAMAGFAGGIYSHYYLYITPEQFGIFATATLLTMVVIGGAGTVLGPAFGAIIITTLPEIITFLSFIEFP